MFILNTLAIAIIFIEGLNLLNYHFLERLGLIIIFNNGFFWNFLLATSTSTNINLKAEQDAEGGGKLCGTSSTEARYKSCYFASISIQGSLLLKPFVFKHSFQPVVIISLHMHIKRLQAVLKPQYRTSDPQIEAKIQVEDLVPIRCIDVVRNYLMLHVYLGNQLQLYYITYHIIRKRKHKLLTLK